MTRGVARHDEILKYIKDFDLYYMRMPTRKEIVYNCKIGFGSLQRIIIRLEDMGKLKRIPKGVLEFKVIG